MDAVELQLRRDGVPLITPDGGNFRTPYLYIVDVDQYLGLYGSGRITSGLSINYVRGVGLFVFLDYRETLSLARSQSETRNGIR